MTVMGPKINGHNIPELVKLEVQKTVNDQKNELLEMKNRLEAQLDRSHELLLGALARVTCLETEISKYHQNTQSVIIIVPKPPTGSCKKQQTVQTLVKESVHVKTEL